MEFLKGLLIQLLFILITWMLTNSFSVRRFKTIDVLRNRQVISIMASLQIIGCIGLAVPVNSGFYYDLRFVPYLIGSVYGGRNVALFLTLLVILIRIPYGGSGLWVNIASFGIFSILVMAVSPCLLKVKQKFRILLMAMIAFLYAFPAYLVPALYNQFFTIPDFSIYIASLTLSTFVVVYLKELLRDYHALQKEAAELEKMQVVSQLAASFSHEVRNPLTTVKGFLQLIEERVQEETVKRYTSIALEEANRATGIIEDYLTFAKPHEGKVENINLADSIEKIIQLLGPYSNQQGICLKKNISVNAIICGDPNKWSQVLMNVCKNGIESMKQNGVLTIQTRRIGSVLSVEIQDNGIGMKPEQIARLGQPFYSLKEGKGTGLGMMVVYQIVRTMGGRVEVKSKVNHGTTVSIIFPLSRVRLLDEERVLLVK